MGRSTMNTGSQSVDRAFDLLHLLAARHRDGASVVHLVEDSGLKRPTVHRLLAALSRAQLAERDERTALYHLGPACYGLGMIAADRQGIEAFAAASVNRLAERSEDTAFFSVRRGSASVCLIREEGRYPIRSHILNVGQTHPLGVAAHGIAMIAALPDDEAEAVIVENEPLYADRYPRLTHDTLWRLIEETRARGWAVNRGLFHENAWAVGVVVRGLQGEIAGALSIGSMKERLDEERQAQIASLLQVEADRMLREARSRSMPAADMTQSDRPATQPRGTARRRRT